MDAEARKTEVAIVIEMVEVKNGKDPWVRAGKPETFARVGSLEGLNHEAGSKTVGPLVEVADHDLRASVFLSMEYIVAQEHSRLMTAFHDAGSKMDIEEVKQNSAWQE
jgi:hypothetical protein